MTEAELIAQAFHEAYERLAPMFSYQIRTASAQPWADTPRTYRTLMITVVQELLDSGAIRNRAVQVVLQEGV